MKRCMVSPPKDENEAVQAVEHALYMKAVGFVQREEKTVTEDDGKGGRREKREVSMKQVPPDGNCIMTWLKDRQPDRWREAQDGGGRICVVSDVPRPEEE